MSKIYIDISDDDFGAVLNCAVRYACGRYTYMPDIVVGVIKPLLNELSEKTLGCMERDIREADRYGYDSNKQEWMELLHEIQDVMEKRGIPYWN